MGLPPQEALVLMRSPSQRSTALWLRFPVPRSRTTARLRIIERFALFLPSAQGRIWFSMWLLSIGTAPSNRNRPSPAQWFRL